MENEVHYVQLIFQEKSGAVGAVRASVAPTIQAKDSSISTGAGLESGGGLLMKRQQASATSTVKRAGAKDLSAVRYAKGIGWAVQRCPAGHRFHPVPSHGSGSSQQFRGGDNRKSTFPPQNSC